jgi:predicted HicB family RNase H-like nuclease
MKNLMEYKDYYAKIEYSSEDDIFFGSIIGIEDSITFEGKSISELKKAFHEAVDDYLDMCQKTGKEPQKYYKGSFNVRISPEIHRRADLLARSKKMSLNKFVENAINEKTQQETAF